MFFSVILGISFLRGLGTSWGSFRSAAEMMPQNRNTVMKINLRNRVHAAFMRIANHFTGAGIKPRDERMEDFLPVLTFNRNVLKTRSTVSSIPPTAMIRDRAGRAPAPTPNSHYSTRGILFAISYSKTASILLSNW